MNQRGFGFLGIVIVIAVIAVLGSGGLYYWKMQNRELLVQPTKDKEQGGQIAQRTDQEVVQKTESQSQAQTKQQGESLSSINVATITLDLRQENVSSSDRDIYYLHAGDIWTVDIQNKKQIAVVNITENITKFSLSPDGLYLYWISDKGELWKQDVAGVSRAALVNITQDMKEVIQETRGDVAPYPYLKGKVLGFWLSPDGNYIAYETLEGHTGCCAGDATIPVGLLNVMRNDGSEKVKIVETNPHLSSLVTFIGWLPDSTKIIFTSQYPDEATQGRPYQIVDRDGKNMKTYMDYYGSYNAYAITVVRTEPRFSLDGKSIVYIDDALGNPTIWLTTPNGSGRKKILDVDSNYFGYYASSPQWSRDGTVIFVATDKKMFLFDKSGTKIAESKSAATFECAWCTERGDYYQGGYRSAILVSDDVSFWSTFGIPSSEKGNETKVVFIENMKTGSRKEYRLSDLAKASASLYLQFSENGRLYYTTKDTSDKQSKPSLYVFDEEVQKNYLIANDVPQVVFAKK